eukprot:TRINITY_DN19325_c0_g2_i1.p1 TRINITY_DN19325_c0_g2~~TRINITY_DN19325_c0_g2_i1.p1  ORF type:complete len:277 (+),score=69.74 TRINITY_DN19325_c0_g2_i1:139-969(+)
MWGGAQAPEGGGDDPDDGDPEVVRSAPSPVEAFLPPDVHQSTSSTSNDGRRLRYVCDGARDPEMTAGGSCGSHSGSAVPPEAHFYGHEAGMAGGSSSSTAGQTHPTASSSAAAVAALAAYAPRPSIPEMTPPPLEGSPPLPPPEAVFPGGDGLVVGASPRIGLAPHLDPEWSANPEAVQQAAHGGGFEAACPPECTQAPAAPSMLSESGLPLEVNVVVKRALDLAQAQRFVEAENDLEQLGVMYPEFAGSTEVEAARDAIALCKRFQRPPPPPPPS